MVGLQNHLMSNRNFYPTLSPFDIPTGVICFCTQPVQCACLDKKGNFDFGALEPSSRALLLLSVVKTLYFTHSHRHRKSRTQ